MTEKYLQNLNSPLKAERLEALRFLVAQENLKGVDNFSLTRDVNSHIHTKYSFSPYYPTKAVYLSIKAGLVTTGIMDHDSVAGVKEFLEAGEIAKMPVTGGAELRVSFAGTELEGRKINNPDQDGIAYVAFHGIPHTKIDTVAAFFEPISRARGARNRKMLERINALTDNHDLHLDYDRDVLPLSQSEEGGSVTERHLLFALSLRLLKVFPKAADLQEFLRAAYDLEVNERTKTYLEDPVNQNKDYDLLNLLKGNLVEKFYIDADEECVHVSEAADFATEHGIILAYAYLGDVTDSVTGDKAAAKFEDDYLDTLFEVLKKYKFKSVTYMPSRNTPAQLERIRKLCDDYGLFQISGEDINQPRQDFVCKAMREPGFENLYDAAWALIGHELVAGNNLNDGMFSVKTMAEMPDLSDRTEFFKRKAMKKHL